MKKPNKTIPVVIAVTLICSSILGVVTVLPREEDFSTFTTKYSASSHLGKTSVSEVQKEVAELPSIITEPGDGGGGGGTNPTPTQPTGNYIKTLGDGTQIYWYHQSSDGCQYDTTISNMKWGESKVSLSSFTSNGCAIYTLAMIFSNLCNQEITPLQVLIDLGCTIEYNNQGIPTVCLTNQTYFDGINIYREPAIKCLSAKYNCSYIKANTESDYVDVLGKGGYIYDQWTHNGGLNWLSSGNGLHFMAVRKADQSGKYYCLTSTDSDATRYMDQGATFSKVNSARTYSDRGFGIYHN